MLDIILAGTIILMLLLHAYERRDLYNRIMSRDITEYRNERNKNPVQSRHDQVLRKWRRGGDIE